MKKFAMMMAVAGLILAVPVAAQADWDQTMPSKWVQLPDLSETGLDVRCGDNFLADPYSKVLADDFLCTTHGPITNVHIWGSWLNDYLPGGLPNQVEFNLSIHLDIPADQSPTGYSMPLRPAIWEADFMLTEFQVRVEADNLLEQFYDPNLDEIIGNDTVCYQYNFDLTKGGTLAPPTQEGTTENPIVYWLSVNTVSLDPMAVFGWKTSLDHWNDDAVFWDNGILGPQDPQEMRYPLGHSMEGESIDLAFVIVPEPATMSLLVLGGISVLIRKRRK